MEMLALGYSFRRPLRFALHLIGAILAQVLRKL